MITNPDPEDYSQSPHRIGVLSATYDLWDRIKAERPDLREPQALRPVVLKCAKRHNILAVKIRTDGIEGVDHLNVNFETVHAWDGSRIEDSRPTAHHDETEATIADLERVTIKCPGCSVKHPGRKIIVRADRLLMLYAGALAEGKQSIVIE